MKNRPQNSSESNAPVAEIFEENNFVQWFLANGQNLLLAFFIITALFVIAYRLSSGSIVKSELDFINAENDYQRLLTEKNENTRQETLQKLESILINHPELNAKYDSLIAQNFITEGNTKQALPFALEAINRTETENAPFYTGYSKTTLLIAEEKYQEALTQALNLKESLQKNTESLELLYAFNLLRIGMLQQQLKLENEELATWNEWEVGLNTKNNSETFKKLVDYFTVGKVSLTNYIENRKSILRKS